jgi:hypothetical protein
MYVYKYIKNIHVYIHTFINVYIYINIYIFIRIYIIQDGPGTLMRGTGDGPDTPRMVRREEFTMKRGTGVIFEAIERLSIYMYECHVTY